jgi:hypothetical protein
MSLRETGKVLLGMTADIVAGFRALVLGKVGPDASLEEKRRSVRLVCRYPVLCISEKEMVPARVRDIGFMGLRLEVPQRFQVGQPLTVRYDSADRAASWDTDMDTRVVWCRRRRFTNVLEVGVEYQKKLEGTWVQQILRALGVEGDQVFQRRRKIRAGADLRAEVGSVEGGLVEGRVVNLSLGGALVECPKEVPAGVKVRLEIGPYPPFEMLVCQGLIVQATPSEDRWFHAVSFQNLSASQVRLLGQYIFALLKEAAES